MQGFSKPGTIKYCMRRFSYWNKWRVRQFGVGNRDERGRACFGDSNDSTAKVQEYADMGGGRIGLGSFCQEFDVAYRWKGRVCPCYWLCRGIRRPNYSQNEYGSANDDLQYVDRGRCSSRIDCPG